VVYLTDLNKEGRKRREEEKREGKGMGLDWGVRAPHWVKFGHK
jgi:hypothetical protein